MPSPESLMLFATGLVLFHYGHRQSKFYDSQFLPRALFGLGCSSFLAAVILAT